jgi:hypothetical protein
VIAEVYEDFCAIGRILAAKNKAKQTQYYLAPRFSGGLKTNLKKQTQSVRRV